MDDGLATGGVLSGVLFGVDEALSTLAFLDPERGVMLALNNVFIGVTPSFLLSTAVALILPPFVSIRNTGVGVDNWDLPFDGVCGPLPAGLGVLVVVDGLAFTGLHGLSRVMTATLWRLVDPEYLLLCHAFSIRN